VGEDDGCADRVAPLPIREGAAVPKPQHAVPWQPVTCEFHAASIASRQPRPAASQSIACDWADGLTMLAVEWALDAGWTSRCQRAKSLHRPIRRSHAMRAGGGQVFPTRPPVVRPSDLPVGGRAEREQTLHRRSSFVRRSLSTR
jgi:hypothetical protein